MRTIESVLAASDNVRDIALLHLDVWEDRPVKWWLNRILSKLSDAIDAKDGRHVHHGSEYDTLMWEVQQIASIAINLLAQKRDAGAELVSPEAVLREHLLTTGVFMGGDAAAPKEAEVE